MLDARFRPLDSPGWKLRKRSTFRARYTETLDLLEKELGYLRAAEIVIEAGFPLSQIRNDGWPRSGARPSHPAVRLSFKSRKTGQAMAFPCDTYDDHEDNLRAIALSLQSLRAVDRYGVTRQAEQYRGWTALPSAEAGSASARRDAAAFLAEHSGLSIRYDRPDVEVIDRAYRIAARKLHPDTGGSHELFVKLQAAVKTLTEERGA